MATYYLRIVLVALLFIGSLARADETERLPGTQPLAWEGELADRMMDGLHRYIERKIANSVERRAKFWKRDFSSPEKYAESIEPNRQRFKKIIGVVDPRVPVRMERFGDDLNPALVAESDRVRIYQVRWPVLEGVWGEGLLLEPRGECIGQMVAIPDADQSPEQIAGLKPFDGGRGWARLHAERGLRVIVPTLVDRSYEFSGNARVGWTNQPHREWIYRQAYQMGRHIIGYEVQKVLAAVEWLDQQPVKDHTITVVGYGEGGLLAFYAAAVEPRIDACMVSGYFENRARPWEEPLYRNVWGLLREFGDAEIASLIAPRSFQVGASDFPKVDGPPQVPPGRRGGAAVGKLVTPSFESVRAEFDRIGLLCPTTQQSRHLFSARGTDFLLHDWLANPDSGRPVVALDDHRKNVDPRQRQKRQVKELENHVQLLVRGADAVRDDFFLEGVKGKKLTQAEFESRLPKYREYFWDEILGRLDDPMLPMNPRSRKIYENARWTGYDVVLDVYEDVFAWGVLLVPKDIKPGERRPVVVCQHGRNGLPKDTIEGDVKAYHDFAARLADRGYIVFAPHNPYRGEDRYRLLSRKANSVKASLFSFILVQHEQILNYLETLPNVDPKKIAFYGLSYGGETAVRVPPLLSRYCLSICSADFNDWARKVSSTDAPQSFMFTIEWEMPYFDFGSKFNYAELASLMVPRPFMVERGHADGVAPDEWVAYEYAKVRRRYDELGLGDRTEIEFFNGPHTINGVGTFRFLDKHLRGAPDAGR